LHVKYQHNCQDFLQQPKNKLGDLFNIKTDIS
jgi:hypothetical protein